MSYRIIRFYANNDHDANLNPRAGSNGDKATSVVKDRVTLEEARQWCNRLDTRGPMMCVEHGIIRTKHPTERPSYCPQCGKPTIASSFDGFTEN